MLEGCCAKFSFLCLYVCEVLLVANRRHRYHFLCDKNVLLQFFKGQLYLFQDCMWSNPPKGGQGCLILSLLSGISGLSFDSPLLSPLLFFLPSPLALSVFVIFLLKVHSPDIFPENSNMFR